MKGNERLSSSETLSALPVYSHVLEHVRVRYMAGDETTLMQARLRDSMARVCLIGKADVTLQYELLSRETSREALAAYDLEEPFYNAIAVETVSLGSAVALLNDLNWYLVRFVDTALVKEPSVSESEWLSRELAAAIRADEISPAESDRFLKIYGLEPVGRDETTAAAETDAEGSGDVTDRSQQQLVEPMLVARTGETVPEYDLRDVEETLTVRVTESEFGA